MIKGEGRGADRIRVGFCDRKMGKGLFPVFFIRSGNDFLSSSFILTTKSIKFMAVEIF